MSLSPARQRSRARLTAVLWNEDGTRRLPKERQLVTAMQACHKDDVWWVCEASPYGPLYFLPTYEWIQSCAKFITSLSVETILEIGAGDGFLAHHLSAALPKHQYIASDSGAWASVAKRMSAADKAEFAGVNFAGIPMGQQVVKMGAQSAVRHYEPDLVIAAWAPPGKLVERAITGPCRYVLDISVPGDVCGNGVFTKRFPHMPLSGPIARRALCRLDSRPKLRRHSQLTLYRGSLEGPAIR